MNKETRLILESLRWIILRDTMKPEFREPFINSIIRKIDETLNPPTNNLEEQRAEEIKEGCGKDSGYNNVPCGELAGGKFYYCDECLKKEIKVKESLEEKVPITEFNKDMSKEERQYYGDCYDGSR